MTPDPLTPQGDKPRCLKHATKLMPNGLCWKCEDEMDKTVMPTIDDPLTPDSPTPLVDAAFVEYPVMDTQKGGDAITIQAARNIERQLRSKNAALRKALEALYHYEARRSSPDTAWEQPMMSNARKALGI